MLHTLGGLFEWYFSFGWCKYFGVLGRRVGRFFCITGLLISRYRDGKGLR